ncbi:TPA: hypothetical protein N0F65_011621 [Lagenidium giganteum]|uniref:Uncharacterized protein n=1 Tax=Lagenidium giganteum TaxID=4803 RepID=A0AAV2Z931_9STRA|nr:TPA: hypothetical protein N0F65_011621 [Lagenidium giganteum]
MAHAADAGEARIESLVVLTARAAARVAPLEHLVCAFEFYPHALRREFLTSMPPDRLRQWETLHRSANGDDGDGDGDGDAGGSGWSTERELQTIWKQRCQEKLEDPTNMKPAEEFIKKTKRMPNFRRMWWEHQFRLALRAQVQAVAPTTTAATQQADEDSDSGPMPPLPLRRTEPLEDTKSLMDRMPLFVDVVEELKIHGRETMPSTIDMILQLKRLRRIEVHHPEQHRTCWQSVVKLIQNLASLRELCFFHGKLTDSELKQVRQALIARATPSNNNGAMLAPITTLEFVSVKIRARGHRELTNLLRDYKCLVHFRATNCLADFENAVLMDAAVQAPSLQRLCVEHNELEDDDELLAALVQASSDSGRSIAWKCLQLGHNSFGSQFLGAINQASCARRLDLERLEVLHNPDVGDAGIRALTPMLSMETTLRYIDVRNCGMGLDGAQELLRVLKDNTTLRYLDIGQNYLGNAAGDVLGDFLIANATVESFFANYIGLGPAGCTPRLQQGLETNQTLSRISLGANRLRDGGCSLLFRALVTRSRAKQYDAIDLSGNLLTMKGLTAMADILAEASSASSDSLPTKRRRLDLDATYTGSSGRAPTMIRELSVLNNDFQSCEAADNEDTIPRLRSLVTLLHSNEWTGRRCVYDDEV